MWTGQNETKASRKCWHFVGCVVWCVCVCVCVDSSVTAVAVLLLFGRCQFIVDAA